VQDPSTVTTFLFTDIEGSSRLWEEDSERMRAALASHDALARAAVAGHRGTVVKTTGDGMHAVFDDPLDALEAVLQLQRSLQAPQDGLSLRIRCGLHAGVSERRDNDYFGSAVNRAARIMNAAHGGQVLLSQAIASLVAGRLPAAVTLRDLGRLKLRDLASPEHVHQLVHPALRSDFPALRSLETCPNNLPQQVTPFVGRAREQADIKALLARSRLVTLFGSGGLGKTRLSLQVAADVLDEYPDGVWLVELAPLRDARLVPQAVASVLGVVEEARRPVAEALEKFVAERSLLIVLDNCEHLVQSCADLAARLLRRAPNVSIIASSREPLRIAGEVTYAVPSLAVPAADRKITVPALMTFESAHLFAERAAAARSTFRVTAENAAAVAGICRSLDGIPLALELAAARVRTMSVDDIVARLGDRLRLLQSGDRSASLRQQTLRASIDWSYDLLSPSERDLHARLAVFAGGWTLDAAEAVGATARTLRIDVADLLGALIEKSLVELDPSGGRYRLLETMRQYAHERLDELPDADDAADRHLRFYVALAESASAQLTGPEQGAWLARLDAERENLLAAHAWCDRRADGAESGLRLVFALKLYLINRGLLALLYRITVEALRRKGAEARTLARCRALHTAGQLDCFMGRYVEALGFLTESLEIARELDDRGRISAVLDALAMASLGRGNVAAARGHLEEAIALSRELGDKRGLAAALNGLAQLHRGQGELDAAEPLYLDVLALARDMGDREIVCIALLNLAMVSIGRDAPQRVPAMLLEVLAIADEIGSKPAGQSALEVTAGLAAASSQWTHAARMFGAADAHMVSTGIHRDPTDEAFLAPLMDATRAALGAEAYDGAIDAGRALAYADAIVEARDWLAGRE
jgi:predicted ATPase/class 3 adenylate cyclase